MEDSLPLLSNVLTGSIGNDHWQKQILQMSCWKGWSGEKLSPQVLSEIEHWLFYWADGKKGLEILTEWTYISYSLIKNLVEKQTLCKKRKEGREVGSPLEQNKYCLLLYRRPQPWGGINMFLIILLALKLSFTRTLSSTRVQFCKTDWNSKSF